MDTGLLTSDVPANHVAYNSAAQVFICQDAQGFYAMSSHCQHAGTNMQTGGTYDMNNLSAGFTCNTHGSKYFADGSVKQGPTVSPLPHYKLTIDQNNHLLLDTSQIMDITCRC